MNALILCKMSHKPTMSEAWITRRVNLLAMKLRVATAMMSQERGSLMIEIHGAKASDYTKATINATDISLETYQRFIQMLKKMDNMDISILTEEQN